jgi:hypothetical protein
MEYTVCQGIVTIDYVRQCQINGLISKDIADCVLKVLISEFMEIKLSMLLKEWGKRAYR